MNIRKLVLATVISYIVLMGLNYLVHGVWLAPDYAAIPASHRPDAGIQERFWVLAVGQLFLAAMFTYIYARGVERKSWIGQGIRYGIVVAFLTAIPYSLSEYDVYIVPYKLAIKWMIAGVVQFVILGIIVAGIFKEQSV